MGRRTCDRRGQRRRRRSARGFESAFCRRVQRGGHVPGDEPSGRPRGYPEIAEAFKRYAWEEAEHASKFAELLGEVVWDTKTNVKAGWKPKAAPAKIRNGSLPVPNNWDWMPFTIPSTKCAKTKRVTEKVSRDFTTVILRNNDSKTDLTGGTLCGSARFSCAAGRIYSSGRGLSGMPGTGSFARMESLRNGGGFVSEKLLTLSHEPNRDEYGRG